MRLFIQRSLLIFVLFAKLSIAQQNSDKVIFLTDHYTSYIDKAKFKEQDADKIYKEEILDNLFATHFQKSENADEVKESLLKTVKNRAELKNSIELILYKKTHIKAKIVEVLNRCRQKLENSGLTIYIMPSDPDNRAIMNRMSGIMGYTAGPKQIILTIDPSCDGWEPMIDYTFAREFTHAYLLGLKEDKSKKRTLLEYMMYEGKADAFAHILYPNAKAPWTKSLTEVQKTETWNKIKTKLESNDQVYQSDVMYGSADFPLWTGYTLGYSILQSAFKNDPNLLRQKWTDIPDKEILEASSYKLVIGKK